MTKAQKEAQKRAAEAQRKRNSQLLAAYAANPALIANPKPAAPAPAPAPAPAAPKRPDAVSPFWSADDLASINGFNTDFASQLANINFGLEELDRDTTFQTGQANSSAKQGTAATQDDAAARGIFRSSIKDAAVYDIEAQRSLQTKFLNDKMTAARLNAGTQTKILTDSKTAFDKAMLQKQAENAQGVNDSASAAWAEAQAAYTIANPPKHGTGGTPAAGAPAKGVSRPAPAKGVSRPSTGANEAAYRASQARAKAAAKAAEAAARKKRGR